mmetsp:Transcript_58305/g.114593  ORF Transcript_58305/g.114593 Transcript_58305/m.114593 type:complete len:86 (-) Transcript_58305:25-282(-)
MVDGEGAEVCGGGVRGASADAVAVASGADCGGNGDNDGSGGGERLNYSSALTSTLSSLLPSLSFFFLPSSGSRSSSATTISCPLP